jgi:hypothetical protein
MKRGEGGTLDIENALPCPFCGQYPEIELWHGGGPTKHMISCVNDACHCGPATTGPTKRKTIDRWNVRTK